MLGETLEGACGEGGGGRGLGEKCGCTVSARISCFFERQGWMRDRYDSIRRYGHRGPRQRAFGREKEDSGIKTQQKIRPYF